VQWQVKVTKKEEEMVKNLTVLRTLEPEREVGDPIQNLR